MTTKISQAIKEANPVQLSHLLDQAEVSCNNMRGRLLTVKGYEGTATFTNFAQRALELHNEALNPMRKSLKDYRESIKPIVFVKAPIVNLCSIFASAVKESATAYPNLTEKQENEIDASIRWYNAFSQRLDNTYHQSDALLINRNLISKKWDSFLNAAGDWKFKISNSSWSDLKLRPKNFLAIDTTPNGQDLKTMIDYRIYNESKSMWSMGRDLII